MNSSGELTHPSAVSSDHGGVGVIDPNQLLPVDEEGTEPMDEMWVNLQLMHFGEHKFQQ